VRAGRQRKSESHSATNALHLCPGKCSRTFINPFGKGIQRLMIRPLLGLNYKKEAKLMDEIERKIFLNIVERILKSRSEPVSEVELSEVQETRSQALNLIYNKSKAARGYIDVCMTMYAQALMEDKADMLIDGMQKLYELIFGAEEGEESSCTKRTEGKS